MSTSIPLGARDKWDARFMDLARWWSECSKDPSTRVGAVVVEGKRVLGQGYNGAPPDLSDDPDILNNRARKLRRTLHAEDNAIDDAQRKGLSTVGAAIFVHPLPPCAHCAARIIRAGIIEVNAQKPTREQRDRWGDDFEEMEEMFHEAGVDMRWW